MKHPVFHRRQILRHLISTAPQEMGAPCSGPLQESKASQSVSFCPRTETVIPREVSHFLYVSLPTHFLFKTISNIEKSCKFRRTTHLLFIQIHQFFFFFGCTHDVQKFPGRGSNLHHSINLSHSSDSARSLTTRPSGNAPPIWNTWNILSLSMSLPLPHMCVCPEAY